MRLIGRCPKRLNLRGLAYQRLEVREFSKDRVRRKPSHTNTSPLDAPEETEQHSIQKRRVLENSVLGGQGFFAAL